MEVNILDIPFSVTTEKDILEAINKKIIESQKYGDKGDKLFIATPNPEMVLEANKNEELLNTLSQTNLNIPDGTGILWAGDYLEKSKQLRSKSIKVLSGIFSLLFTIFKQKKSKYTGLKRITGTDMMKKICKDVVPSARIFLLGAAPDVAQAAKNKLIAEYDCIIVGTDAGAAHPQEYQRIRDLINLTRPDILFVAFGAPKQEVWLARNLPYLKTVKVAMGVGGAFDFISGKVPRAPRFMRKIGLEWLFRLFYQPSRIKRIYNATVKFPIQVIRSSLK